MSEQRERAQAAGSDKVQMAAEASVIGSVMANRSLMSDLGDVSPQHFTATEHQKAWSAMLGDPSIGDAFALQIAVPELTEDQVTRIAGSQHARATVLRARTLLFEQRSLRDLRRIFADGLAAIESGRVTSSELAYTSTVALSAMSASATTSESATAVALVLQAQAQTEVISTGIRAIDYVTYGGLHVGQLLGIFARYKVGKTVLMATLARNLEKQGIPTLAVSLERRKHDFERFIVARALGIDARDLDLNNNAEHKSAFAEYIEDRRHLWYIHKPGISIDDLRARIIAEVHAHQVKVVLVDYWQLITNPGSKSSQQEKQQEAAQMLADLASDLDIAIVVTGQINQEGQPRGGEGILASAGIVIDLHRPEDSDSGFVQARVCNKGPTLSKGDPLHPSLSLMPNGPHFDDYMEAA